MIIGLLIEEYYSSLEKVVFRLQSFNLRVNIKKCDICKDSVEFCGYIIDKY